ncbi:phosphomannomutase [Oceanobacter sp. 4_MG-2023]|uniref:phosphomannomutase n=1 Tax=Oceanobacter sp. 4_MG-2023 TaxID=3062623 RepID=UPI0027349C3B|nr:phosphomannomutase [Oceanobacter sp. 4_MG-2023]MDP2548514.1 phosphomannomutase [Oceanobacter sp. 4_MG-2023]
MLLTSNNILVASGIQFGTSGARGLVEQFTDPVCAAFTQAFLHVMKQEFTVERVALGIDRRPSSPAMAAACAAAAVKLGVEVDYYGVLPTPALALQAMQDGVPAIVITGSHIPFDRNGIKFYRPDGEITKVDEQAILQAEVEVSSVLPLLPDESVKARQLYMERYTHLFAADLLQGKRIGLYEHSAAGRELNADVLRSLGAEVISLGRTDTFVPIDTEAVSEEDQQQALAWSAEYNLDAIFSTDGDGDRPLIADEHGHWLRGDILGLLCARALNIQALAVPVSCNTAIEKSGSFAEVKRTRIGSPYVIEGMADLAKQFDRVAGFEANGGFLLQSAVSMENSVIAPLPTRDALLPALMLLAGSALQGKLVSALLAELPERFTASDRIKDVPTTSSKALIANWANNLDAMLESLHLPGEAITVDTTDGLRVTLSSGDIVHLRPSGNAPELRCYAEADDYIKAKTLVNQCLERVQRIVSG